MRRQRSASGLLWVIVATLVGAAPLHAEPRLIRGTAQETRILRGPGVTAATSAESPADSVAALLNLPPVAADSAARAWTQRMIDAYGGPAALLDWLERGERRGRQVTYAPVRAEIRFVDRRAGPRLRFDARLAGFDFTMVSTAEGDWQALYGIVSDTPERERDYVAALRTHDEALLLAALRGTFPARLETSPPSDPDVVSLLVWGPRGSATRFRAGRADARLTTIEFVDRNPDGAGDAFHVAQFEDWRPIGPQRAPLLARRDGFAPLRVLEFIAGSATGVNAVDTLDLATAVAAEVFVRPGAPREAVVSPRRSIVALDRIGDHQFIDVRFADAAPRRFLVDSGAAATAVSRELAAALGLEPEEILDIAGAGGGTVAGAALLPPFNLGSHRLSDIRGLVLDLAPLSSALGTRIDGVLGVSSFARFAVTWDFARGVLEFAASGDAQPSGPRGTRVPFTMAGGLVFAPVRVDGGTATDFVIDTGAWRTILSSSLGAAVTNPPDRRLPGIPFSGVDGRLLATDALRLRSLEIGGLTIPRPIVLAPAPSDRTADALSALTRDRGVLGLDVLRRFRLTLDFPRQELILEPVSSPVIDGDEAVIFFCGPGVVLTPGEDGAGARVSRVLAGSPAAAVGVAIGDRVLAVDGVGVEGAGLGDLRDALAGHAGTSVKLRLRRAGGPERTLELVRALLL